MYQTAQIKRKRITTILLMALIAVALIIPSSSFAQRKMMNPGDIPTINANHQADIIDSVTQALNTIYVFPEVAKEMETVVRKNLKKGKYKKLTNLMEFVSQLTDDFHSVNRDLHLRVMPLDPGEAKEMESQDPEKQRELEEHYLESRKMRNFSFKKLEILPGNIGYLDLRGFNDAAYAGATAIAAMNFLSNSDALIFDLRKNGGGSPSMIQLLSSYLFDESTHLNSFYIREQDSIQQFWTNAYVTGKKMTEIPVYVLTSSHTFSAAEEFTYNLKNLKRATIIGETTGGGAHPVDMHFFRITDEIYVTMSLPFGRAINPITGTNWEGTGVTPDIATTADAALEVAQLEALQAIGKNTTDEQRKLSLDWASRGLTAKLHPVSLEHSALANYAGTFGPRIVTLEDGSLYYQRGENPKFLMIPMGDDMFMLDGLDYFRIEFEKDTNGEAQKLIGHYDSGRVDQNERSKS